MKPIHAARLRARPRMSLRSFTAAVRTRTNVIRRAPSLAAGGALLAWMPLVVGCGGTPARVDPDFDFEPPGSWTLQRPAEGESSWRWWSTFADAALDTLIAEALAHNYDLRVAVARVDAAVAQARIAGADALPNLSAGVRALRDRRNFIGTPIPSSTSTTLGVSLDSSWEIDLWGRIRSARSAALADAQASWADARAAQLSLAAQTAKAYFAATEARSQVDLARTTLASYATSAERVRDRFERGLRSSLDLRLALSSVASAEALLEQRRVQHDRAVRQLEILVGRYPAATLAVADSLPPVPPDVPVGLPSEILVRRPDLVAAERRLAGAGARISEARRAFFPSISLTGSAGSASEELQDLADSGFFVWNIVGGLVQPLFQAGRLRARVRLAEASAEQGVAGYAQAVLNAYSEVESALAAEGFLAGQERALSEAARQAVAARALAGDRYRNGLEDYVTVLEAQRRALAAQSDLLVVRRQRLDARINLHLALGGGFELPRTADGHVQVDLSDLSASDPGGAPRQPSRSPR